MTDPIKPAIPGSWPVYGAETRIIAQMCSDYYGHAEAPDATDLPAIIALANAALPEGDPRKITRKRVSDLKDVAGLARDALRVYGPESSWGNVPRTLAAMIDRTEALADALASYLPPEGT